MKIWGPAPSRRIQTELGRSTPVSEGARYAEASSFALQCGSCNVCEAPGTFHFRHSHQGNTCGVCSEGESTKLSEGGQRFIAKLRRESLLVDLRLEGPPLQTAADVHAAITVAAQLNHESLRTLQLGPWGGGNAGHGCTCDPGAINLDSGDQVVATFASLANLWSQWTLRSFSASDVTIRNFAPLLATLSSLPKSVTRVGLVGLGLGPSGMLGDCIGALTGGQSLYLDFSQNGLSDSDLSIIAPMLGVDSGTNAPHNNAGASTTSLTGLNLSGNPKVTSMGLRSLLEAARHAPERLLSLDLSECALGPEGGALLAEHTSEKHGLAALKELTLYRTGLRPDGICSLVDVAARTPALRALNVVANGQHVDDWVRQVGKKLVGILSGSSTLRVLTISCPENELSAAKQLFEGLSCRVILVPNEQNNYNRPLFTGHVH